MTRTYPLINPDPVDDICQDNAHRAGASNHHQNGSGENPMVGNQTTTSTSNPAGQDTTGERVSLVANNVVIGNTLLGGRPRQGKTKWARLLLAQLVTGLGELLVENEELRAERDAANDSVLELLHDLDTARAEGGVA